MGRLFYMRLVNNIIIFFTVLIILFILKNLILEYKWYNKALRSKNIVERVDYYCQTISAYVPLSPFVKKSIYNCQIIIDKESKKKDKLVYLYTLERLRGSLYSIQSFYSPYEKIINSLTEQIVDTQIKLNSYSITKQDFMKFEKRKYRPNPLLSFMSIMFFVVWFILLLIYLIKKSDKNILIFILFVCFYFLWIISLYYV